MIAGRNRWGRFWPLLVVLSIAVAFLASGCLWGVVRDADTGNPLPNVAVSYVDTNGQTGTATTDGNGIFVFDQASGPVPAAGPVSFNLSGVGHKPLTAARLVQYDDNPEASMSDLSSFWEVQSFNLVPEGMKMVEVELQAVDITNAVLAPPPTGDTSYQVVFRVYDATSTAPACENSSGWVPLSVSNPPPQNLSYSCLVPGDRFRATVTVTVSRLWFDGFGWLAEDDVSTAQWPWLVPDATWTNVLLDSTDAAGPDIGLSKFEALARARAITIVPLGH